MMQLLRIPAWPGAKNAPARFACGHGCGCLNGWQADCRSAMEKTEYGVAAKGKSGNCLNVDCLNFGLQGTEGKRTGTCLKDEGRNHVY